ncbi:hypothetical protein E8E14_010948 [Neopestalotiopsis sp. 37M]|nr:hypothetical protein E8E14_010948 [Neopestalotiopsis sp. 37M]
MAENSVLETGIPRDAFLGISITFLVLTGIFVAVRVTMNVRNVGGVLLDDYSAILAVIFFSATFGLDDVLVKTLSDPKTTVSTLAKYGVAVDVVSGISLVLSKTPILLLYTRLFGVKRWVKFASTFTLGIFSIAMLASIITIAVVCRPTGPVMPASSLLKCSLWSSRNGLACGALSLAVDIIIFIIPIPVIIDLRLPRTKKFGLAVVFTTGLFAIGASAVSLRFKMDSLSGKTTDTSTAIFFTNLEWCIAVMVGCVPGLNSFWGTYILNGSLYSRIASAFSNRSLGGIVSRSSEPQNSKNGQGLLIRRTRSVQASSERIASSEDYYDGNSLKPSFSAQGGGMETTIVPLRDVAVHRA